jgi:hypothetical protein
MGWIVLPVFVDNLVMLLAEEKEVVISPDVLVAVLAFLPRTRAVS